MTPHVAPNGYAHSLMEIIIYYNLNASYIFFSSFTIGYTGITIFFLIIVLMLLSLVINNT